MTERSLFRPLRTPLMLAVFSPLALACCTSRDHEPDKDDRARGIQLLDVSSQIPDLLGRDQDGNTRRLRAYLGRPLLVYFYPKDGTPGCTKEACAFRDVWKRFETQGVQVVGVSRDDSSSHARFAGEHRIPFPLIADPDATWARAFGVPSRDDGKFARVSFLFSGSGKLARVYREVDPAVHAEQVLDDARKL